MDRTGVPAAADDFNVQVSGHFDALINGVRRPLVNARVEIMDSDNDVGTLGDDLLGVGDTGSSGDFTIDGVGGDGGNWSWSKPDVYARVLLDDQWTTPVRMKDDLGSTESMATAQHDHDNVEGTVSIGSWWWGSQASNERHNASAPSVWLSARDAAALYMNLTGQPLPQGKYEIQYWAGVYPTPGVTPFTTLATTYWPRHYSTGGGMTTTHELYHALRHGLDGDQTHWDWDDTRFRYGRSHEYCDSKHVGETQYNREGFAFNEGWALFGGVTHITSTWRCDPSAPEDMTLEGDVANRLERLERTIRTTLQAQGSARQARELMLAVLRDHAEEIHTFEEFCRAVNATLPGACGPAPPSPGVRPAEVAIELSSSVQMAMVRAEIAAQSSAAEGLIPQLVKARAAATEVSLKCTGEDCDRVRSVLVRPAFVEREIKVHRLVATHLSKLTDTPAAPPSLRQMELDHAARTEEFQRQLRRLNLEALDQAIKRVIPLAKVSPAASGLLDGLQRKRASRSTGPIPRSDQPRFLVMRDAFGPNTHRESSQP